MRVLMCFILFSALAVPVSAWADQTERSLVALSGPATTQPALPRVGALRIEIPHAGVPELAASRKIQQTSALRPVSREQAGSKQAGHSQTNAADPAALCETAVTTAEYVNRLPPRLLGAISLIETGRIMNVSGRLRPWPWTINAEGEGQFFDTKDAAIVAVKILQNRGVRSIDVGCLQVNLMYHPDAFTSLQDAFDPRGNANYAARFLNALYANAKAWAAAVGAYHSETPALGDAYRALVMARWQNGDPHAPEIPQGVYGDFARSGTAYGSQTAYGKPYDDKAYGDRAYGAFAPSSLVYGAFAPR